MAKTANLNMRLDPTAKAEAEKIFAYYGITLTQAINIFIQQSRNVGGLPFDIKTKCNNVGSIERRGGNFRKCRYQTI